MKPSRMFREGDLAELYREKTVKLRETRSCRMVEYVIHCPKAGELPESYGVAAAGVNALGVQFLAKPLEWKEGRYFFQVDINGTYDQIKDNPQLVYADRMLALGLKRRKP